MFTALRKGIMPLNRWRSIMGALGVLAVLLLARPTLAQGEVFLSLSSSTPVLQTGEIYEIQIVVENVTDLWVTSMEIAYDPTRLYIMGTRSGSPVQPGPLLTAGQWITPRNAVDRDTLRYTVSLLAPAEPINGTGVLAIFRVAPLAAGPVQLAFRQANLTAVTFQQTAAGRSAGEPQRLDFTPVLLDLTVTGDPVSPPPEITATPPPTSTPLVEVTEEAPLAAPTDVPTLVNITRAPTVTAEPQTTPSTATSPDPALILALAILGLSGLGLIVLLLIYLRRYRR
jgi:hypothetical protein